MPIETWLFSQPWSSLDITTSACDSRHKNEVVVIKKENVLILSLMRFLAQMQRHEEKKMQSYYARGMLAWKHDTSWSSFSHWRDFPKLFPGTQNVLKVSGGKSDQYFAM